MSPLLPFLPAFRVDHSSAVYYQRVPIPYPAPRRGATAYREEAAVLALSREFGVTEIASERIPLFRPLPGVESFWRRAISLPMHLHLTDEQVDRIVATIAEGW